MDTIFGKDTIYATTFSIQVVAGVFLGLLLLLILCIVIICVMKRKQERKNYSKVRKNNKDLLISHVIQV